MLSSAGAMTRRCQGEEHAKSAGILPTFFHFFPLVKAARENSQRHGALIFMAMEHGTGSRRAVFWAASRRKK